MSRVPHFDDSDLVTDYRTTPPYTDYCKVVLRSMPKGKRVTTRAIREAMGELYSNKYPLGDVLLTLSAQREITLIEGFIDRYVKETRMVLRDPVSRYNGRAV